MNLILKSTGASFILPDVGVIIATGAGSDFSDSAGCDAALRKALGQSWLLRALVSAASVVVNDGVSDLGISAGLQYLNRNWFQAGGDTNVNFAQVEGGITDTQHGNRSGGSLHAAAVAGVSAGFMSSADKTKLDAISAQEATAVAATSTGSAADILIAGMTLTPGAGTYLAWFSATIAQTNGNTYGYVSLYAAGAQVTHSERSWLRGAQVVETPVATHALITVAVGQAIEARWRTVAGTISCVQRSLLLLRIA